MAHERAATRSEREPDCHLAGAITRAREKKIGHVHTRNQQQQSDNDHYDGSQSDLRGAEHWMHAGLRLRHDGDAGLRVRLGELSAQLRTDRLHARARLLHRDTGPQPRHNVVRIVIAVFETSTGTGLRLFELRQGQPDDRVHHRKRAAKAGRRDTDDLDVVAIHRHLASDNFRVSAEERAPTAITEHRNRMCATTVVFGGHERATADRDNAKHGEVVRRYYLAKRLNGTFRCRNVQRRESPERDTGVHGAGSSLQIVEVRNRV